ncbi:TPA: hypothetical protein RM031_004520 [Salmonella enterica subsp. enterica serovar Typhi]|nr:hypothetical protein [Salmonella enterica]HDW4111114.1 hypothetical protein [Salmonella enterica subsp. enterica serovar Typhi]HDW5058989.1 hypothetical protein [Salmonella enterica subsp. enterica serovar Typhi]HDW5375808.1 hypothetical protein [Salmonella enterica subsp. enterica serovar Typhi]HDW6590334.1 hypothetical protein [Salmonella enterica subsp. enterica serovar Typhi]
MRIKRFLLVLALLTPFSSMANVSKWSTGETHGVRSYAVSSKDNYTLTFECDVGFNNTDPNKVGTRLLTLMKTEPGCESFDAKKEQITLKVGDDEYPISSIGSSVGDSYWYGFWSDTPDMEVKTFDAYVDGKKIATFTLRKAAELFNAAPEDGCLKRAK